MQESNKNTYPKLDTNDPASLFSTPIEEIHKDIRKHKEERLELPLFRKNGVGFCSPLIDSPEISHWDWMMVDLCEVDAKAWPVFCTDAWELIRLFEKQWNDEHPKGYPGTVVENEEGIFFVIKLAP
jgi:hypothetical protein